MAVKLHLVLLLTARQPHRLHTPHSAMYKSSPGLAAPVSRIAYLQVFWQFTLATGMMPVVYRTIVQCVP